MWLSLSAEVAAVASAPVSAGRLVAVSASPCRAVERFSLACASVHRCFPVVVFRRKDVAGPFLRAVAGVYRRFSASVGACRCARAAFPVVPRAAAVSPEVVSGPLLVGLRPVVSRACVLVAAASDKAVARAGVRPPAAAVV